MAYSDGRHWFAAGYFATGYWAANFWAAYFWASIGGVYNYSMNLSLSKHL